MDYLTRLFDALADVVGFDGALALVALVVVVVIYRVLTRR